MSARLWFVHVVAAAVLVLALPAAATPVPSASKPPTSTPCVEVRIGNDSEGRLDCINRALRAAVDQAAPPPAVDTGAGAPPSRLGQPTPAALKQRLGNAYGHSLVPQRPPRTFAPPLPPVR